MLNIKSVKKFEVAAVVKNDDWVVVSDFMGNQYTLDRSMEGNIPMDGIEPQSDILILMTKEGQIIKWKADSHHRYANFWF